MTSKIQPENIAYLEAMVNYTKIHFKDGSNTVMSYTLKKYEISLAHITAFSRIHRRFIINKNCISSHIDSEVTLACGRVLPVARRRRL